MKNAVPRMTPDGEVLVSSYLHNRALAMGTPLAGTFELTPRCNFSCRMCYVHENGKPEKELTAEEWISLGQKARDAGMLFLLLTGGEPMLRKDFAQIYKALRKMGLMISINTNGSLLNDELFELFRQYAPTRFNISLYGANDETYRNLCGNASFDVVRKNILRLKEAGFQVKLNCSVTPYNAHDVVKIYDFAKEHELRIQSTSYMYPPVRVNGGCFGDAPARFTAEDAAKYTLLCREQFLTPEQLAMSANHPVEDCDAECGEPMSCRAGRTTFWVTWKGQMTPCGTFPTDKAYDIRALGFEKAWEQVRQDVLQIRMPKECAGCSLKKQCVACAAAAVAESGDSTVKPEYICEMIHRLHDLTAEKYPMKGEMYETES